MKESPPGFRRRKWALAVRILGAGMAIALVWALWAGFILHQGYPSNTTLGDPTGRYSDFTDETLAAVLPNPYVDPISVYPPSAFLLFRAFSVSENFSLILIYFLSLTSPALLLTRLLQPVIPAAWERVSLAFFYLALSYPVLFCLDRGNIEIMMAPLIGWALYFYRRHRDLAGTACLLPAICLKLYPALLLILLLRRKKAGLALACGLAALIVNIACAGFFAVPALQLWSAYCHDLDFFRDYYILANSTIEGSASLWNTYKIVLIALHHFGLISGITFGFDGAFIQTSYLVYGTALMSLALACAAYSWLHEREQPRAILVLLLFLSIAAPNGADYRLIYASMALAMLTILPQRRRGDWLALILIALAVIPKKEILLTFVGETETRHTDVSLQGLLNPVFILLAMATLMIQSGPLDRRQALRRFGDLLPWRWHRR
jgi:hypothetical protein